MYQDSAQTDVNQIDDRVDNNPQSNTLRFSRKNMGFIVVLVIFLVVGTFVLGMHYQEKQKPETTQTITITPAVFVTNTITTTPVLSTALTETQAPITIPSPATHIDKHIVQTLNENGSVKLIISTHGMSAASNEQVITDIYNTATGDEIDIYYRWDSTGQFAANVYTIRVLDIIANHPQIKSIQEDIPVPPAGAN